MVIKGKTEELLVRQLKTCERNMQELTNSIKRPNLRIMGIEGEEVLPEPAVGPCLCELVSGIVRNLQGTEAKVSGQTLPV
jgi:hypothetical protein